MKQLRLNLVTLTVILLTLCGMAVSTTTVAAPKTSSPIQLLQHVSNDMLHSLRSHHSQIKHNRRLVFRIVHKILLPHVDLAGMSRSVLGRRTWQKISPAERKQFAKAFTTLVIRTYASALQNYTDEKVHFFPIRGGYQGRSRVQVMSHILRKQGPVIPVSYRLVRQGKTWKVYDFSVEGISLIRSFQSQFAAQLSSHSFERVLKNLQQHNRQHG